jgi:hypothetical protein
MTVIVHSAVWILHGHGNVSICVNKFFLFALKCYLSSKTVTCFWGNLYKTSFLWLKLVMSVWKRYKSPDTEIILAELIQAPSEIHKHIHFVLNKEQWKGQKTADCSIYQIQINETSWTWFGACMDENFDCWNRVIKGKYKSLKWVYSGMFIRWKYQTNGEFST